MTIILLLPRGLRKGSIRPIGAPRGCRVRLGKGFRY